MQIGDGPRLEITAQQIPGSLLNAQLARVHDQARIAGLELTGTWVTVTRSHTYFSFLLLTARMYRSMCIASACRARNNTIRVGDPSLSIEVRMYLVGLHVLVLQIRCWTVQECQSLRRTPLLPPPPPRALFHAAIAGVQLPKTGNCLDARCHQ